MPDFHIEDVLILYGSPDNREVNFFVCPSLGMLWGEYTGNLGRRKDSGQVFLPSNTVYFYRHDKSIIEWYIEGHRNVYDYMDWVRKIHAALQEGSCLDDLPLKMLPQPVIDFILNKLEKL